MAGADVFTIEPDEVHKAVEVMFGVEEEVGRETDAISADSQPTVTTLKGANTALGDALGEAVEWWKVDRAGGFAGLVGSTGEYLATCAEEAVEIDQYNAGMFDSLADLDRYPDR